MRRILALILALCMAFALAACGSEPAATESEAPEVDPKEAAEAVIASLTVPEDIDPAAVQGVEDGVLTVAMECAYAPYNWTQIDDSNNGVAISNMSGSYASFTKPSFAPPGILFPIIWTILYLLMGVSSYIVAQSEHPDKLLALRTYFIQLFFNFMWSILFFGLSNYLLAFFWLLLLILLIIIMIVRFHKIKPIAAYLQIPYLFWCIFAAILNFAVYLLN